MYRCKECGSEFDIKPDYCDCGNDTFDEIVENIESIIEITTQGDIKKETTNFFENKNFEQIKQPKKETKTQQSEPIIKFEKPNIPQIKIEPVSLTIFLICLLMSVFVIFFVGNPKEDNIADKQSESIQTTNKNIPSIDKIWDNTLPVRKTEEVSVPVVQEQNVQEQIQTPKTVEVKKNETKLVQPIQQKPAVNTQKQPKNTPVKTTQSQVQPKQQSKPTTTTNTSSKNSVSKSAQTPTQAKNTQPQPAKTVNPQEMINYKIALRNKIASKIDFTNILGDGTCVVSFKVSQSGTLTNRTFVKQSENGILNDIVYNAIISTQTFNSPPSSYNNETLKFTVKMYDGRYEVSLN